jgi:transcription elongation factor Elf1
MGFESTPLKSGTNAVSMNNLSESKVQMLKLSEMTQYGLLKCKKCIQPLTMTENSIMYKNEFYHPSHFTCFSCQKELADTELLEKNDNLYCYECHNNQFSPVCEFCNETVKKVLSQK